MNKKMILKIAILSCCLVTASQNAIAGNIPAIAYTFKNVALSTNDNNSFVICNACYFIKWFFSKKNES